jgi:plastocyanin
METTTSPTTAPDHRPRSARTALLAVTAAFAAVALLAACSGSSGYGSSSPKTAAGVPAAHTTGTSGSAITIDNFAFSPTPLHVKHGTKVTVTNKDSTTHTWTADSGSALTWTSPDLPTGSSYSFTFAKAGTYSYHCKIHPSMTGTVVVS